jgi:hypothetical protein
VRLGVPPVGCGYRVGMEKREHSVPDGAPGVEVPHGNDEDDLRDSDGLEKLGEALPPNDDRDD